MTPRTKRSLKNIFTQKFGRLQVVKMFSWTRCLCKCRCGSRLVVPIRFLCSGHTRSCGCLRRDIMRKAAAKRFTTHGFARDGHRRRSEYNIWVHMKERCYSPKHRSYEYYGGRGIQVCARWRKSFINFFADVGRRPSKRHSIDRVDNDGNYEPGNVRWATKKQQIANRRPR